jgi:ABC-type uncharacterized transport system substrate-binding protein
LQRRDFIRIIAGAAAAWPLGAYAQQPKKIWRIGMLETVAAALKTADYEGFLAGMESLGYVEGRDFKIEYRSVDGHPDRFPKLAQELVSQNVDLITTRGTPAAFAAKNATKTIPVVMAAIGEPLLVVASLARPGGNITGLSAFVNDLMGKRTELLRDMLPGLSWIGALLNMSNRSQPPQWTEIQNTARTNGVETQLFDVRSAADLATAIDDASKQDWCHRRRHRYAHAVQSKNHYRACREISRAGNLSFEGIRRRRRADFIWRELSRPVSPRSNFR